MRRLPGFEDCSLRDLAFICGCDHGCLHDYISGAKALPGVEARLSLVSGFSVLELRKFCKLKGRRAPRRMVSRREEYAIRRRAGAKIRAKRSGRDTILWRWDGAAERETFSNNGRELLNTKTAKEMMLDGRSRMKSCITFSWDEFLTLRIGW